VLACATCLLGDPTITTMGTEKPFAGRMRVSAEYISRGEKIGQDGINENDISEQRINYGFSYSLNKNWIFSATVPVVNKSLDRFDMSHEQSGGVGDIDLNARWFIGSGKGFVARYLWGVHFGATIPVTEEEKNDDDTAIDFDSQPGPGALVPSFGVWYGSYRMPWFLYTSATYQHAVTEGHQGYQGGDAFLFSGLVQYAMAYKIALQLSLDNRFKIADKYDDEKDPNSGGLLTMLSPGIAWTPIDDLILNLKYQYPIYENVRGRQVEEANIRIGVTYDFSPD